MDGNADANQPRGPVIGEAPTALERMVFYLTLLRLPTAAEKVDLLVRKADRCMPGNPLQSVEYLALAGILAEDKTEIVRKAEPLFQSSICIDQVAPLLAALMAADKMQAPSHLPGVWQASERSPDDEVKSDLFADLVFLADHYESHCEYDLAAAALQQALMRCEGPQSPPLWNRLGALAEQRLADPGIALQAYGHLAQLEPDNRAAFDGLRRLFNAGQRQGQHIEQLAEHYKREADWDALLTLRQGMINFAPDDNARAQLAVEIAELLLDRLQRPEESVDWLRRAFELTPDDDDLRDRLTRIGSMTGRYDIVAAALDTAAQKSHDIQRRITLGLDAGRIRAEKLNDKDWAASTFERVLALSPMHPEALAYLDDCLLDLERWHELDDVIRRRLEITAAPEQRRPLLGRRSELLKHYLGRPEEAAELLREVLQNQTDDPAALETLADMYRQREDWNALLGVLGTLAELKPEQDERIALLEQMAWIAENEMQDAARMFEIASRVLRLRPHDPTILRRAIDLCIQQQDWSRATAAIELAAELAHSDQERVQWWLQAAEVHDRQAQDMPGAIRLYDRILSLEPSQPEALAAMESLYERAGWWDSLLELLQRQLKQSIRDEQRAVLHRRRGMLLFHNMNQEGPAAEEFRQALALNPRDVDSAWALCDVLASLGQYKEQRNVLNRLRALVSEENDLRRLRRKLVWTLEQLLARAESAAEKAALCLAQARVLLEENPGDRAALALLDRALDLDPTRMDVMQLLTDLVSRREGVRALADRYQAMLERLTGGDRPDLQLQIARELGNIAGARLRDRALAIQSYERVVALAPDDVPTYERLCDLYYQHGDLPKAVLAHRALLKLQPERDESYRALKQIFLDTRQFDQAWVIAGVLLAVHRSDDAEKQLFERHMPTALPEAQNGLTEQHWRTDVALRPHDFAICQVLREIYEGMGSLLVAKDLKSYGLKRSQEIPLDKNAELPLVRTLHHVCTTLSIPLPRLYFLQSASGLMFGATIPPVLIAGPDMLKDSDPFERTAMVARALTLFHPLFCMAGLFTPPVLGTLLAAVWRLVMPMESAIPGGLEVQDLVRQYHKRFDEAAILRLRALVQSLGTFARAIDPEGWLDRIDLLTGRIGLTCCGRPDVGVRLMARQGHLATTITPADRIRDMVRFAVDAEHFRLREYLGLSADWSRTS